MRCFISLFLGLWSIGMVGMVGAVDVTSGTQTDPYSGDISLNKISDGSATGGTYTLNRANTYTGGTTITAGMLNFTNVNAFGSGAITLKGGTLQFNTGNNTALPNNVVVSTNSTLDGVGNNNYHMNGTLTGTGDLTVQSASNGRFGIFLNGSSTGYTGNFKVVGGSGAFLVLYNNVDIHQNSVNLTNGNSYLTYYPSNPTYKVGMITGSGQFRALGGSSTGKTSIFEVGNDIEYANHTFSGTIYDHNNSDNNTLGIKKVGTNTWTLTGANNTYMGPTTVSGGVLELAGSAQIANSTITVENGGTLKLSRSAENSFLKPLTVNNGGTVDFAAKNAGGAINTIPTITINAGGKLNASTDDYSNVGKLVLNGGTVTSTAPFTGSDAKTYGYFLLYDTVSVTANSSITAKKIMIRNMGSVKQWTVDSGKTLTVSSEIRMENNSTLEKLGGGTLSLTKSTNTFDTSLTGTLIITAGTVKIAGVQTLGTTKVAMAGGILDITSANVGDDFTSVITGTGTLTTSGSNWFNFKSSLAGFSGTMNVNTTGGVNFTSDMGDASKVNFVVASNCESFSLIDSGTGVRLGMMSGGKASRPSSSSGDLTTLTVGNDTEYADHTWEGAITNHPNGTKKLAVVKTGSNTWTLESNALTFTEGLTVSGGTLELASTANLSGSNVTVKNNGTLKNAGTIAKNVTVEAGGTFEAAGGTVTGNLTLAKDAILTGTGTFTNATLARGSMLEFDLDALQILTLPSSAFDAGEIIVALEALDAEEFYGQTFNLIGVDTNVLDKLAFDFSGAAGNIAWMTGYTNGNVWAMVGDPSQVPEPATWTLLLLCLGMMFRRKKGLVL